jgi:predicted nuclease with TOPRIM domain
MENSNNEINDCGLKIKKIESEIKNINDILKCNHEKLKILNENTSELKNSTEQFEQKILSLHSLTKQQVLKTYCLLTVIVPIAILYFFL